MGIKYGWSDTVKGAVSSAFNLGHTITNFYGGYLASAYSPKLVLSLGVVVWSAFTLLTPPAAALGLWPLFVVRACMGLGEGVAYPTMQAIIKGWVPRERRSRSLSLMYSGHQIGSILSLLWSPLIIASSGVDLMFYLYGLSGFVWIAFWHPLVSPDPPLLRDHLPAGFSPPRMSELPWRTILTNRVFWALMACHSTFGILYNTAISWMPRYYNSAFGLDVRSSSFLSVLPWVAMACGTNISGWVADYLINRKLLTTTRTRALLQLAGSVGPAVCLLYLAWGSGGASQAAALHTGAVTGTAANVTAVGVAEAAAGAQHGGGRTLSAMDIGGPSRLGAVAGVADSAELRSAVILMTMTMAFLGLQAGGFASTHQDIATRMASVLFGTTNAAASLAGSAFVYMVGVILDSTGSWSLVFQIIAACCLASCAAFLTLGTSEPQFD
ncbi:hypothetical protein HXX76_000226 [Chlamydomonas incerta]|uniref:Major facilitator superfamily (MFS) profile domain-containing protein n=1 Tax=Chlamydomonas incerta TaxID=51695 RepID=A0A835WDX6_CHLIN|nr:hypothetical protein HXX76_000226 [Chlamydomonas incerta]|eukprot:KAG2445616.1 hypothetical protein HXX76_000226 [Chlamydomonas incerta]